jgi:hypothetical protein
MAGRPVGRDISDQALGPTAALSRRRFETFSGSDYLSSIIDRTAAIFGSAARSRLIQRRAPMCDQCIKLDDRIARYKRIKDQINDKQTQEAADRLVAELEAKKATLHPE